MRHISHRAVATALLIASLAVACRNDPSTPMSGPQPTGALLLSTGSPTKDEDPSVLLAGDGSLFVAWFSDRGGNNDVYLARTTDGVTWSQPVRVTTSPDGDFYPTLIQDAQGAFHLTWFRWDAPARGHIWYNSSADGLTWNQNTEVQVTTTASVDDWVPTIAARADGTLLVFFVSEVRDQTNPTTELYVATRSPGQTTWNTAVAVSAVNSATLNDHLPFIARTGATFTLVWVRCDQTEPQCWLNPDSDVYYATSPDGVSWSSAIRVTNDTAIVANVFPQIYAATGGAFSLLWISTRLGTPRVFEMPLASLAQYPTALVERDELPAGYSHRISRTSNPNVYLGVWVQGQVGSEDVYYRFFEK